LVLFNDLFNQRKHMFLLLPLLFAFSAAYADTSTNEIEEYDLISQDDSNFDMPGQPNNMNPLPNRPRRIIPANSPENAAQLAQKIEDLQSEVQDLQSKVANLEKTKGMPQITPSARPEVKHGWNIYLTGDWLYWKAQENGLNYALKTKLPDANLDQLGNGHLEAPSFSWDSGFRIGLGWNTAHDGWDLYANWSRFYTDATGKEHASDTQTVFPTLSDIAFANIPCETASSHLKIHFNQLDVDLGREFYVSTWLSLKPVLGIRTIWIDQHYRIEYDGQPTLAGGDDFFNHIHYKNDFWGVGPEGGLQTQWELGAGFSVFGDAFASLFYGHFQIERTSTILTVVPPDTTVDAPSKTQDRFRVARFAFDTAIGLRWDYEFAHDRIHLGLQAGWEDHIFFGQNQLFDTDLLESFNKDLTLQGLTVSARLDF
jgi:hypothetical protein